jgi:threonine synthase
LPHIPKRFVLELFHGPTSAFKDFGARFLAACLRRLPRRRPGPLTILVATSGDTGAAVGAAFHRSPACAWSSFIPMEKYRRDRHISWAAFGDNVHALRVAGRFDDCQRMVKPHSTMPRCRERAAVLGQQHQPRSPAAADELLRACIAGLVARTSRTAELHRAYRQPRQRAGCLWARQMGLPIGQIRLACNANATLPDFFAGARLFATRDAVATLANAMDVGAPSNFERLRWTIPQPGALRAQFTAQSVDDRTICTTIAMHAHEHNEVFCPHTATAMHVLDELRAAGNEQSWAVVATAHPAKFENVVEPLVGHPIDVPPPLAAMLQRPVSAETLPAEDHALRQWLLERASQSLSMT